MISGHLAVIDAEPGTEGRRMDGCVVLSAVRLLLSVVGSKSLRCEASFFLLPLLLLLGDPADGKASCVPAGSTGAGMGVGSGGAGKSASGGRGREATSVLRSVQSSVPA